MASFPPGLVLLASYPKSGNTWMRILLSNLMHPAPKPERINALRLPHRGVASRVFFEVETLVDSQLLWPEEVARLRPAACDSWTSSAGRCFMKTHEVWGNQALGTPPLYGQSARAVVYLARDPRDVAVSLAAYRRCSVADAIAFIGDPCASFETNHQQFEQRLSSWSKHVCGWLNQTSIPLMVIRYEDLLASTTAALRAVLRFLGASFSDADPCLTIARAVRHSSFEELRRQEETDGFEERPGALDGNVERFFRKGVAGAWRGVLTGEQIAGIEKVHGPAMQRLGYQLVSREIEVKQ